MRQMLTFRELAAQLGRLSQEDVELLSMGRPPADGTPERHRRDEARKRERVTRVYVWKLIRRGAMPAPVQLSANRVGWDRGEIEAWLSTRPRVAYAPSIDPPEAA